MLVFFDIDGTLVEEGTQTIPQSAVRAVQKLQENGHIAVINTGRPYSHIDPRVLEMGFRGCVCGCGMEVLLDDCWLSRQYPERQVQELTVEAARACRMAVTYETFGATILLDGDFEKNPIISGSVAQLRTKGFTFRPLAEVPDWTFIKLLAFWNDDSDALTFRQRMEPYYTIIDRGFFYELVLKGCSKAQGMQLVMDALHTGAEEVLAIGDSTNDLPMFSLAGHTVCMGNGTKSVKEICEYVTADLMENGVEKALQHYGLI